MDIGLTEWLQHLDAELLLWIQGHLRAEALDGFWKGITWLGEYGWFWIVLSLVLLVASRTRPVGVTALVSLALCAVVTNLCLKLLIARPRPYDAVDEVVLLIARQSDYSFPSGHTCAAFATSLICLRMLPRRFGVPLVCLASLVAFSRMYLGVHYPGDVLGGFLVALVGSTVAYHVTQRAFSSSKACRRQQP